MSILIRGMEMPKNCYECPLYDMEFFDEEHCRLGAYKGLESRRFTDCPLIELHPHGRLIDADVFERVIMMMDDEDLDEDACFNVVSKLDAAPTIIESEGEDGRTK